MKVLYSAVLCLVSAQIKGVHPKDADHYRNKNGYFHCISDPSIKIPWERVNDDYCDCPDGSDEPGTSACSRGKFWCANKGHVGSFIPSRYVNDGKCDYEWCCDGSDELPGLCPDKCEEMAAEQKRNEAEKQAKFQSGLKAREVFVAKAQELRTDLQNQIKSLESEIELKKAEHKEAEVQLQELQELNKSGKLSGGIDPELETQLEAGRQMIKMAYGMLETFKKGYEAKRVYADQLATVLDLMKRDYNPNFNDPAVKQAINSFEDAKGNIADDAFQEAEQLSLLPLNADDTINYLDTLFLSFHQQQQQSTTGTQSYWQELSDKATNWLIEKSILPASHRRQQKQAKSQPKKLSDAEDLVKRIDKEIDDTYRKINELKASAETENGPDDVLRALQDVCVKTSFGEYEYEMCYYKTATQRGNGQFSQLGHYKSHEIVDNDHLVFKYADGAKCWNGPPRSAQVVIRCGEVNELLKVEEIEKCVYTIDMLSPAACIPPVKSAGSQGEGESDPVHSDL